MSQVTCIGFNSIYQTPGQTPLPDNQIMSNKPAGKRIWAWLVLCDDGTASLARTLLALMSVRYGYLHSREPFSG
jgi:hypothetical protein